jgi:hypothetical protein
MGRWARKTKRKEKGWSAKDKKEKKNKWGRRRKKKWQRTD